MATIKHFFRKEQVYETCNDRGVTFKDWVNKNVEHYCCSECGTEVDKSSVFCSKCGVKFTGVRNSYKSSTCYICNTKFKQLSHESNECCSTCQSILNRKYGMELAKAFFELGKKK